MTAWWRKLTGWFGGKQRERPQADAATAPGETAEEESAGPREIGGPSGPEPTRYGDWERKGIASDF